MAKQDSGDDLSKEIRQKTKPLFHCDLLRSTATNVGTYSSDMARKMEDSNDFKTEPNIIIYLTFVQYVHVKIRDRNAHSMQPDQNMSTGTLIYVERTQTETIFFATRQKILQMGQVGI